MEKIQLDLNAPLLSVRRFSSPSNSTEFVRPIRQQSLPINKAHYEFESTKPVAVPFHWEHVPGRPKDEPDSSSHTPRFLPGRLSDTIKHYSGEMPKLPPGRVPGSSRYNSGERLNDNIYRLQVEAFSSNVDHANLLKKLNESLNCDNDSDSESNHEAYSDALDTLDYSVSGLSGCHSSGLESSGTFSIDKQTRDFMMDRFLPAAKAVVLETPQHVVKKPMIVTEQTKPLRKVVSGERKPLLKQYDSPYYKANYMESEDGDEELPPVHVKRSGKSKTWGILPKFCVKNSLCRLNPLQGMKSKTPTRCPTPSTGEVRRLTRNALSGPLDKKACPVPQKKKFHSGLLSRELPQIENKLTNDSYEFLHSRESHKSGLSTLRRYRSGSVSPYRNESPRSPFREGAGFLGVPKEVEDHNANKIASSRKLFKALHDVSRNQVNSRELDPVEKTLYVDSVKKTNSPLPKSLVKKMEGYEGFGLSGERLKFLEGIGKTGDAKIVENEKKTSPRFFISGGMENVKVDVKNSNLPLEYTRTKFETKEEFNEECGDRRDLLKSPLPPPLPKSPSESWLWRTLANPFSDSRSGSPLRSKEGQKGSKINLKWEAIVKSSNPSHDHVRYSAELVPHISRRQNKS